MKTLLLYFTFCLSSLSVFAQTGINLVWENELSNTAGAQLKELAAIHADNGLTTVAGYSSTQSGIIMYIAQYQANGQLSWEATLPTPNQSSFNHLLSDSQGNLYAVGTEIIGGFNDRQVHLAKFDGNGQLQWQQTYRGPNQQFASPADLKLVGNYLYMCGSESGVQSYDLGWVAKFDLSGSLVWDKAFDSGNEVGLYSLTVDNAGNLTAVGAADYGYSYLVLQYDSNGSLNWQYPSILTSSSEQYLSDIAADDNGNVYVIGSEESGPFYEFDIVTLKLSSNGALAWEKRFNNGGENGGAIVRIGPNGNIFSFGNKEDNFDHAALTIAYDPAGTKLWEADYEIDNGSNIVDVEIAANGDLYLGVQDYDSLAFVRLSSDGNLLAEKKYGQDEADYLSDLSLSSSGLFGTAYKSGATQSAIFSLQNASLGENFLLATTGLPLSDARPGAITTDGNHLWLSSIADGGDSAQFTITKMDLSGNVLWEQSQTYFSAIPAFPYLAHDGAGNVIGLFQNGLTVSAGHIGLVKYNAAGAEQFTVLLDSANVYSAGGLAVDNAGNIYLTGYNEGTKKMLLSRYDAGGNLQWTKYYQSPSPTFPYAKAWQMQLSPQNKLVIAAIHKGATNDNDLHLFQYADDGTLEWHGDVANQSGNLTDFGGMQLAANGDITIFGSSGIGNYVAARFDSGGSLLWDDKGSSAPFGAPRSMAVDAQGRTWLCFSTASHAYVRQLSSSGSLITDNQLSVGSSGSFYFPWRCAIVNGQLAILGEHLMPQGGVPFQMLLDDQLQAVYVSIDSSRLAKIQGLAVDPNGDLYGAYVSGDLAIAAGYRGALVQRFTIGMVGIEDVPFGNASSLSIYPNPAREQVSVKLENLVEGTYRFALYDLQGRTLFRLAEERLSPGTSTLSLRLPAHLGSGTYLLGLSSARGTLYRRIVILK